MAKRQKMSQKASQKALPSQILLISHSNLNDCSVKEDSVNIIS